MDTEKFTGIIFALLEETFEKHHGIYTDERTSLLETLETVTAEEASVPVGGSCPTLAAQVAHTAFSLNVLEGIMRGENPGAVDWEDIWDRVKVVTPDEWETSKQNLQQSYQRVVETVRGFDGWEPESRLWVLGIIAHSAYHLGAIRQALCIVRSERGH